MTILFAGIPNVINETIVDFLSEQDDFQIYTINPQIIIHKNEKSPDRTFDLFITDLNSFDSPPTASVHQLIELDLARYLIVIHHYKREKLIKPILEAGADGYIHKNTTEDKLIQTIKTLKKGKAFSLSLD